MDEIHLQLCLCIHLSGFYQVDPRHLLPKAKAKQCSFSVYPPNQLDWPAFYTLTLGSATALEIGILRMVQGQLEEQPSLLCNTNFLSSVE